MGNLFNGYWCFREGTSSDIIADYGDTMNCHWLLTTGVDKYALTMQIEINDLLSPLSSLFYCAQSMEALINILTVVLPMLVTVSTWIYTIMMV